MTSYPSYARTVGPSRIAAETAIEDVRHGIWGQTCSDISSKTANYDSKTGEDNIADSTLCSVSCCGLQSMDNCVYSPWTKILGRHSHTSGIGIISPNVFHSSSGTSAVLKVLPVEDFGAGFTRTFAQWSIDTPTRDATKRGKMSGRSFYVFFMRSDRKPKVYFDSHL